MSLSRGLTIPDGKNGLRFRAGVLKDLATKIFLLHQSSELRTRLAENAPRLDNYFECRAENQIIVEALARLAGRVA